jgi:hypothetical protein
MEFTFRNAGLKTCIPQSGKDLLHMLLILPEGLTIDKKIIYKGSKEVVQVVKEG